MFYGVIFYYEIRSVFNMFFSVNFEIYRVKFTLVIAF